MIKPEMIPKEVVEAAAMQLPGMAGFPHLVKAALISGLNAWPGFEYRADAAFPAFGYGPAAIILPLPQEEEKE